MVYWPEIINRALLAWAFILPAIVDLMLIISWSMGTITWWQALIPGIICTPLLFWIVLNMWSWYCTEGSGPID